ncbi:hypothetical protein ACK8HX_16950 [Oryzobacter sp. R7]|uniref:hypothetical protein n=1 Tax=Oryzobacter faecalis TaxID=3388656 RepID=UPI00398CDD59
MTTTMTAIHATAATLLVALALGGCGGAATGDAAGPAGTSATTTAAPAPASTAGEGGVRATAPGGSAIPDGTWTRTATMADATMLGVPPEVARQHLGADGENDIELRVAGRDWAQFMEEDGTAGLVLGDRGTAGYDAEGRWVATSHSEGCPDCAAAFTWSVEGDRLTLTVDDLTSDGDPVDALVTRLVMEGTFTRR